MTCEKFLELVPERAYIFVFLVKYLLRCIRNIHLAYQTSYFTDMIALDKTRLELKKKSQLK